MLYIQIYIYIYTHNLLFSFFCLGDLYFFQQKCRFSLHFWVILDPTKRSSQPKDPRRDRRYCDICPPGTHIDEGHCERCEERKAERNPGKKQKTTGYCRWSWVKFLFGGSMKPCGYQNWYPSISRTWKHIYMYTHTLRIMHKYVHVHVDISLSLFCVCSISLAALLMSLSLSLFLPIFSLSFLLTCCYMILCSHILYVDRYNYFLWCHCVSVHTRRYAYGHLAFQ